MDIKFMRSIALDFNQGKEYFNVFLQLKLEAIELEEDRLSKKFERFS
ncbi:MAG: hypothetical protein IPO45_00935 [Saprospiraceae bacterium]|jgi:hypothetical protein|nr:hypothetical protein [Candidatus Brachybacter algidus]MBP7305399.1 hypothetical protein [Saprospiraceae bacterium]MBK7604559.1 hypothetical protein [Candidatus Brachybacter algidus]MBK9396836.1 hypothetical protein [Candidatus Brachybacter algidus]MBK9550757.1 hypothetical protein [Candidatus Brachybacter algidus]MBP7539758.1 hypothetical protein [Saprospiraceae bacterium]